MLKKKRRTHEEIKKLVLDEIKRKKTVNKRSLLDKFGLQSYHLDKILEPLENKGEIMIARIETFKGEKKVVQAVIIKYVKEIK